MDSFSSDIRDSVSRASREIPAQYIAECFYQDADGVLYWKARPREHFMRKKGFVSAQNRAGRPAGNLEKVGYIAVEVWYRGSKYRVMAHRIAWVLHTGAWPKHFIDHIDRDKTNNRVENLRDVARDENARNNGNPRGSGLRGAYPIKNSTKFKSQLLRPYQYLGIYETAQEAHDAHLKALAQREGAQ